MNRVLQAVLHWRPCKHLLRLCIVTGLSVAAGISHAQVTVLTSIRPVQLIVAAVTEGISTPQVLISGNQSFHHFTLRPSSVREVNQAELLVWVGPDMETWLTDLYRDQAGRKPVIQMMSLPGLLRHPRLATAVVQESGEQHGHEEHEEHEEETHAHAGEYDGHAWLDTDNAAVLAAAVAERLQAMDPANARRYAENLARFRQLLAETQALNQAQLAPLRDIPYAVYHNAFQYFERQNGLQPRLVFVEDEEVQPGIRHILALRQALAESRPVCLLEDVTSNPATVSTVLGEHELRRERADIQGAGLGVDASGYAQLLRNLAKAYQQCLQP